ncbi:protein kinase domain-containing protein [Citrus sinensis]|uniref:Protein kinase domain-containing protein n=1 Tax=Citrus sinensis TaxID=2711 RepID=A0ACB8JJ78_CITSI|nr:protein kinase domain-containing protein [Citrus sinensis]
MATFDNLLFRRFKRDGSPRKSQLHDPLGVTKSWNNSINLCQWTGVTCGHRHQRVTKLDLESQNIGGFLSPYIGNLSFLRVINLANNSFHGQIPKEVGRLFRLETIVLSNNSFSGKIPTNLSRCFNLIDFWVHTNNLVGEIQAIIGNWLKIERLSLYGNQLTGQLPPSIGNLSALQTFDIAGNKLDGRIPDSLGQLRNLNYLGTSENDFSGMFPLSVCNISSLDEAYLFKNRFKASLPVCLGFNLPKLTVLVVAQNNLTGFLPQSLSNASKLEWLELNENHFSGQVRINFNSLPNLSKLYLGRNNLGTRTSTDLDFITLLTNCSKLVKLGLVFNRFGGALPHSIANLSTTMTLIAMEGNQISGTIPPEIRNLFNLNGLGLEYNQLTGTIPPAIGELRNLQYLGLVGNNIRGIIPDPIGNLTLLNVLQLGFNKLQGSIPSYLGKCQNLMQLSAPNNKLNGTLPPQIFGITTLSKLLDLSENHLSGSIPLEVGNLKSLVQLDISRNNFSNEIPVTLSACTTLEYLLMQGNSFNGSIPQSLNALKSIKELDLSCNNLSGQIPIHLGNLPFLEYLNLSYNHFEGKVPKKGVFSNETRISLTGNEQFCGGLGELHLPACHSVGPRKETITLLKVVIPVIGTKLAHKLSSALLMEQQFPIVSYAELSKATKEFSSSNRIGKGSFGFVYKGNLGEDGMSVAVKVMNLDKKGATKSFVAECEALRNIRHRNLIKIITICSSIDFKGADFKAIVYEYMQYGSVDDWLHHTNDKLEVGKLNLIQRQPTKCWLHWQWSPLKWLDWVCSPVRVAGKSPLLGEPVPLVASVIEYLHNHCQPPIVHGDLKPSNVLLDHDMVAHVSDFGLARFLSHHPFLVAPEGQSSSIEMKGTIGYIGPEYGMGGDLSMTGDVYSFGILLLEMFTRRRPTDNMFNDGLTLHGYAKMALPKK